MALDHGEEAGSCGNIPSTDDGRRSSGDRKIGRSGLPAPPLPIASLVLFQPHA
jgi:hypothetical protein